MHFYKECGKEETTNGVHHQIEKFVDWMKAREGKVRYSQARRGGPIYYDGSSFVERKSGLFDKLMALQEMVKSMKWNWASQPYQMTFKK